MKKTILTTAFILGMGMGQNAHADLNDGLVAHWSFDDCKATDNSGNGHDGTINGNPQCVDGVKGKAFSFDGSNGIRVDNITDIPVSANSRTISTWVKMETGNDSNNDQMLIGYGDLASQKMFALVYGVGDSYDFGVWLYGCSNDLSCDAGQPNTIINNKFYHLVTTYDEKTQNLVIYMDGVKIKNKVVSINTAASAINIGQYDYTFAWQPLQSVRQLDDLRIYNRALTEAEVLELYSGGGVVKAEKPVLVAEVCSPTQTAFQTDGNSGTVSSSAASCVTTDNSTLADLVDLEKTNIDYDKGKIKVVLKHPPHSVVPFGGGAVSNVRISIGDEITNIEPTSKEFSFDFYPKSAGSGQQDKLVKLDFYYRVKSAENGYMEFPVQGTIYGVTDNVQLSDGIGNRAILASRKLSETKPHSGVECKTAQGISSECNNFFATDENTTFQNTLTHRIVDFDKLVGRVAINNTWAKSPYGKNAYKNKSSTGDNGRIPLLLIHGWQGGGLTENPFRNPAKLGLWEYSELHYWQHFLDYYLTSPALQKKYHLYLYHYPSYKHVTYNASMLNDLLQEVGQTSPNTDLGRAMTSTATNTPQNNLTIVAHSMGGMVARSLIEEYKGLGDSKVYGASMNKLNKLITLDTPHHGSTASDPSSILAKIPKDMLTQGAADLNWDNYDNQLQNDVVSNINENYRWVSAEINNQEFDSKFCNVIDCNNTANPWLLNMNKNFESLTNSAKDKYVLYVAWMSSFGKKGDDAGNPTAINPIENGFSYNIAEEIGIPDLPNGVAEPVTSALLSEFDVKTQKTLPFNPERKDEVPTWFNPLINPKQADDFYSWMLFENTLLPVFEWCCDSSKTLLTSVLEGSMYSVQLHSILIPTESVINLYAHPYGLPYRIFWDYDHEKMVNGAYLGDLGIWDQFISKGVITNDLKTSAFRSNLLRNHYIFAASSYPEDDKTKKVLAKNPKTVYNPLKTEPLYLILERDLLKK